MKRFDISLLRILAMLMVTFTHCIDPPLYLWEFKYMEFRNYSDF